MDPDRIATRRTIGQQKIIIVQICQAMMKHAAHYVDTSRR
jgi:hypothetical protein